MPAQEINITGWPGGVNLALPPGEIADDELAYAKNVELDSESNLRTRSGTRILRTSNLLNWTSIHHFERSDGTYCALFTSGSAIHHYSSNNVWTMNIQNFYGLSLPSPKMWHWVNFADINLGTIAIGVNGGTGAQANPVKVVDTVSYAQALGGSPPKARYIAVGNFRVWLVSETNPNRLYYSDLGNAESWPALNFVNVGGPEGGAITAIYPFQGKLLVFKRNRIYAVVFGSPNTDDRQWEVIEVSSQVGTFAPRSIQEILGDLIFLSEDGVVSLGGVLSGERDRAVLSRNIPDLRNIAGDATSIPSAVLAKKQQYWISIPLPGSSPMGVTWVLDYSRIGKGGKPAWFMFTDGAVGASLGVVYKDGTEELYIGGEVVSGAGYLMKYESTEGNTQFKDYFDGTFGSLYQCIASTKSYNFDDPFNRKYFHRYSVQVVRLGSGSGNLTFQVKYTYDDNDLISEEKTYVLSGVAADTPIDVTQKIVSAIGNKAQSVQFSFRSEVLNQGMVFRNFGLELTRLTKRRGDDR